MAILAPPSLTERANELSRFYKLLEWLAVRTHGPRQLGSADGAMIWPRRGVYFFFESAEIRSGSGAGPRVVRVGTHGLVPGTRSTLWGRLAQHRGVRSSGNHRGSVFRLIVGLALARRELAWAVPTWGLGSSAPPEVTEREQALEARVSAIIGQMRVLWLAIDDEPGPESLRGFVERNSIALLSAYRTAAVDPASPNWLGHDCPRERVRMSGLWNSDHVDETIDPTFLDKFERLVESISLPRAAETPPAGPIAASRSSAGGNAGRVIAALQRWPDLDDDELAQRTSVTPRQQVNIICRRLEQQGILKRFIGVHGKIINRLTGTRHTASPTPTAPATAAPQPSPPPINPSVRLEAAAEDTLVIIPCSGRKAVGPAADREASTLLNELPEPLASRLASARRALVKIAHLDESTLMPAWRRYAGALYESARRSLDRSQDTRWFKKLLILSGAYGVVRAIDPIGTYDLAMDESLWPPGLLANIVMAYTLRHRFRRVIALTAATTGYARILRRVDWRKAGVADALLLSPHASPGAMVKVPRALGEALSAMVDTGWDFHWRSSDGLCLRMQRMD